MTDVAVAWTSSDTTIARVASGLITAVHEGSATITASAQGIAGVATVTVVAVPVASITVTPSLDSIFTGLSRQYVAVARDAAGNALTGRVFTWSSSDATIAVVSSAGVVVGLKSGLAHIVATIGTVSASGDIKIRQNPVQPTSYLNFKESGVAPLSLPDSIPVYNVLARGYGDFYGRGAPTDMFAARVTYDVSRPQSEATMANYSFYRREGTTWVEDNSILAGAPTRCIHPRKAVVADFNADGRPDVFLACHGYDAAPYPGERSQIILSQPDGKYIVRDATDVGFWHGASAADLNGDGYPDVVLANTSVPDRAAVYLNNKDGTFTREASGRLPSLGTGNYYSVELADVNEDGLPDLLLGGHEFDAAPTRVWINPGTSNFSAVTPVTIAAVPNEGVVLDFLLTGTGPTRTIWLSRTSGGDGTFYQSKVLQKFIWPTQASAVVSNTRPGSWVPWLIHYSRSGQTFVGSDDPRTPLEVALP